MKILILRVKNEKLKEKVKIFSLRTRKKERKYITFALMKCYHESSEKPGMNYEIITKGGETHECKSRRK